MVTLKEKTKEKAFPSLLGSKHAGLLLVAASQGLADTLCLVAMPAQATPNNNSDCRSFEIGPSPGCPCPSSGLAISRGH